MNKKTPASSYKCPTADKNKYTTEIINRHIIQTIGGLILFTDGYRNVITIAGRK